MNDAAKFITDTRRRYRLHLVVEGVVLGLTVGAVLAAIPACRKNRKREEEA